MAKEKKKIWCIQAALSDDGPEVWRLDESGSGARFMDTIRDFVEDYPDLDPELKVVSFTSKQWREIEKRSKEME